MKAKCHYVEKPNENEVAHKAKVHNSLICVHIARCNYVSEKAVRNVIPDRIGTDTNTYGKLKE
jgi:hypothetical protein